MAESVQPARGRGALATLAFMSGPSYGSEVEVPHTAVTLGRGPDADVRIDDDSISDVHARLEYDLGAWRLTDLESTNGTAVEGVRLAPGVPTPLPYGATVRLGGVRMQFREVETADPDAARAAQAASAPARKPVEGPGGFRLPVWLAFVILVIVIALAIMVYIVFASPEPVPERTTPVPTATAGEGGTPP